MISIYTDENIDVLLKPLLRAKGLTVITTQEQMMIGKEDREQLEHAIKLKCAFLTHNRIHFEQLFNELVKEGKEHYGIIISARRNVFMSLPVVLPASLIVSQQKASKINFGISKLKIIQ